MLERFKKWREIVLTSPALKTFFSVIIPILSGILSATFIIEITANNSLDWSRFYLSKSFYGLLFLVWLIYWYNRASYLYEKEVGRFLDKDYCVAYMRSQCLPEAAERYKELIRNGEGGELRQAMDELKEILR